MPLLLAVSPINLTTTNHCFCHFCGKFSVTFFCGRGIGRWWAFSSSHLQYKHLIGFVVCPAEETAVNEHDAGSIWIGKLTENSPVMDRHALFSLSLLLFILLIKLCLLPGWEKAITGCNLSVPVTFFFLGLIISTHHVARIMLTLAVLRKKMHFQLSEDIRLIWPLQSYLPTQITIKLSQELCGKDCEDCFHHFNSIRESFKI